MTARLPVLMQLVLLLALGMVGAGLYAMLKREALIAEGFFWSGGFCLFIAAALGVLFRPRDRHVQSQRELLTLLLAWALLPVIAALPLLIVTPSIGVIGAWFEMVAALTTTGGSTYPDPLLVPDAVHLWRGLVGWFGGLLTLISAYAVLAPRRLGGFEVMTSARSAGDGRRVDLRLPAAPLDARLNRAVRVIVPVYTGMTALLALLFNALAEPGLTASVHAMSIISTSGITSIPGGLAASGNLAVEIAAAVFLVLAATRLAFSHASQIGRQFDWRTDPELRLMGLLVGLATLALVLRHWAAVIETPESETALSGLVALWGAAFTSLSFLTTTGFESASWEVTQGWSGRSNPAMILLTLAAIGGGAATTAGGIKLIRAHAMLRHARHELARIMQPYGVSGSGYGLRGILREGAMIAWTFVMLFALGFVAFLLLLTATGMEFQLALFAATSALSNTGPLFAITAELPAGFATLGDLHRVILAAAMLLGRIETLVAIVLLHPDSWPGRFRYSSRRKRERAGKFTPEPPI